MIERPGIYDLPAAEYHADPVIEPSLSRSIAKLLIEASPAHAFAAHPRLGGTAPRGPASGDDDMDIGSVAHSVFLEGVDNAVLVPFDEYRSNAAKAARDEAKAAGKIPLKPKQYEATMRLVEALHKFRDATKLFTAGKPEQSIIWQDDGTWLRGRVDWLPDDPSAPILDLKTTGGLANSETWSRRCFEVGGDIQAAMYARGLGFLRDEMPDGMLFVVIEAFAPYAVRVFGLDRVALDIGETRLAAAFSIWRQCRAADAWPSYPPGVEWLFPPGWIVRAWEESARSGFGRASTDPELIKRMVATGGFG